MPLIKLETSAALDEHKARDLAALLSKTVAEEIGKPEQYVMVSVVPSTMLMGGQPGPTAFADVRSIGGLNSSVNRSLSEKICSLIGDKLGVPPNRVFVSFTEYAGTHWGWDGRTFG